MIKKNITEYSQFSASNFGIFIAGFSHSGSSAVVDWLRGNSSIVLPPLEEIHSLNHGLSNLLKVVGDDANHLEWIARKMLCPDSDLWPEVFGERLSARGVQYWTGGFIKEVLYIFLAKLRARDILADGAERLNSQLKSDFRADEIYLETIKRLTNAIRKSQGDRGLYDGPVLKEISSIFALFYSRWSTEGKILVFNNAFTGRRAKYFDLIDNSFFNEQIIIFVCRDPRDQFVRKITGSSFSGRGSRSFNRFMINKFITEYRTFSEDVQSLIRNSDSKPYKQVMLISFEDFVHNISGVRDNLAEIFTKKIKDNGFNAEWSNKYFSPEISKSNIGVWRDARLDKEIQKISEKLPEFLHPEAN